MKPDNDCTCRRCVNACKQQPGWFAPGEAEKAAELLGIPFEEFKKFIIKDSCDDQYAENAPYIYAPRKIGVDLPDSEFREYQQKRKQGTCVFLKEDRCSIHQAKPYECAKIKACDFHNGTRDVLEAIWINAGAPLGMRPDEPNPADRHYDEEDQ